MKKRYFELKIERLRRKIEVPNHVTKGRCCENIVQMKKGSSMLVKK